MFDDIFHTLTTLHHHGEAAHQSLLASDHDSIASSLDGAYSPGREADHPFWHGTDVGVGHHPYHDPGTGLEEIGVAMLPHQAVPDQSLLADFHGVGDPVQYSHYWHEQTGAEDCAVMAQGEIFESLTGHHLSEQELCHIAQAHGLYDPEIGTRAQDTGKLLNLLGISTEQKYHATLSDLVTALQHHDRVIVGLNANEIWYPSRDSLTGTPVKLPLVGHAVWVTGVEQEADGSVKVVLCDSGTAHGAMEVVDAEDFLNAWADCGDEMVIAHQPAELPGARGGHE